jgi:putative heme-binding domain-containing protein
VLALSPILNPRDQYTVYFDSPRVRGAYPFICTFPGHWQVMRGVLFVLDDEQPMPEDVPFVAERTFVRDWQLAELAADADALGSRSAHAGHVAFHVAGCAQCHAVAGQGATWGPDLTKIRERYQGSRLLQQILEPSSEIHPAFQTVVVERRDGTVVSGLVVAETEQQLTILPNPLWPEEVTRIEQSAISSRSVAPVSTMPTGLLMTLTRDEILDLLAYLIVGGEHGPSPGLPSPSPSPRSGEGK